MSTLLDYALEYQQGKMSAMDFSWGYIALRSKLLKGNAGSKPINEQMAIAQWVLYSACDRFELEPDREIAEIDEQEFNVLVNQAIKIGLSSEQQFNDPQFRKEVEQALKSIGLFEYLP